MPPSSRFADIYTYQSSPSTADISLAALSCCIYFKSAKAFSRNCCLQEDRHTALLRFSASSCPPAVPIIAIVFHLVPSGVLADSFFLYRVKTSCHTSHWRRYCVRLFIPEYALLNQINNLCLQTAARLLAAARPGSLGNHTTSPSHYITISRIAHNNALLFVTYNEPVTFTPRYVRHGNNFVSAFRCGRNLH